LNHIYSGNQKTGSHLCGIVHLIEGVMQAQGLAVIIDGGAQGENAAGI